MNPFVLELLISGGVGLAGGLGTAYLVHEIVPRFVVELKNWPWAVEFSTLFVALFCSTLVGLVSGLYPAWRAATLDPTVALRYE